MKLIDPKKSTRHATYEANTINYVINLWSRYIPNVSNVSSLRLEKPENKHGGGEGSAGKHRSSLTNRTRNIHTFIGLSVKMSFVTLRSKGSLENDVFQAISYFDVGTTVARPHVVPGAWSGR